MPDRYRIAPGTSVDLASFDPRDKGAVANKEASRAEMSQLNARLEELQELLYAEGRHKLLIVLQGVDTSGKDGTIRHVFDRTNPQGVRVACFKKPSTLELSHDYLWRVHARTPRRGEIVIFNRSHYEDVTTVRVLGLVSPETCERRIAHICAFERMLADEGVHVLKFFLHISKKEQKERLQARLDEPHKRWKFAMADLEHRALWNDFAQVYGDVIGRTSTEWAPWWVIPSDRKWVRNLLVSRAIVTTLESLDMKYPPALEGLDDIVID